MSDIDARFAQAQADVKELSERPGNLTLLRQQASVGDVQGDKPGFTDIAGKYKHDAWGALIGTSQETAKQQYVELVDSLKGDSSA